MLGEKGEGYMKKFWKKDVEYMIERAKLEASILLFLF